MNKTKVTRSWKTTLAYAAGGLVAGGLSALLFATIVEGAITAGIALIPSILALILLGMAISGASTAPCPGCGALLEGLSAGSNDGTCCPSCHQYVEGKRGELWLTDPARIADSPQFGAVLGERFSWPDGCCVCGQAATRKLPFKLRIPTTSSSAGNAAVTLLSGGSVVASGGGVEVTVEVPHCDQHKDGAQLHAPDGPKGVKVLFRSYPYLRRFCETNGVQPG